MTAFKLIAAYLALLLLIEMMFFSLWVYLTTKNFDLALKYCGGVFRKKDITGLSKSQLAFTQLIYVSRMLVIFLLIMHILALLIKSI